ncbi:hypothetical protein ISS03_01325, partial [Patescibacteria group bacterium]|nr:hypothetical protein [Patescibacteria group bacterium]
MMETRSETTVQNLEEDTKLPEGETNLKDLTTAKEGAVKLQRAVGTENASPEPESPTEDTTEIVTDEDNDLAEAVIPAEELSQQKVDYNSLSYLKGLINQGKEIILPGVQDNGAFKPSKTDIKTQGILKFLGEFELKNKVVFVDPKERGSQYTTSLVNLIVAVKDVHNVEADEDTSKKVEEYEKVAKFIDGAEGRTYASEDELKASANTLAGVYDQLKEKGFEDIFKLINQFTKDKKEYNDLSNGNISVADLNNE